MTWTLAGLFLFSLVILFEQAHLVSPMVLAWSHRGLRQRVRYRWVESILLPAGAFAAALLSPFLLVGWVYWFWNIWHFGMQNYGLAAFNGWRGKAIKWGCLGATAFCMAGLPWLFPHNPVLFWVLLFVIDFPHWLTDISLSALVSRQRWLFVAAVCLIGCGGFLFKVPRVDHVATLALPWVIQARWGAGMIHFIYSRMVWKGFKPGA